MNTPTLVISFATVVLGGVSLTGNNKILGLEIDGPMTPEKAPVQSSGIYSLEKEEVLPVGVTREP